MSLRERFERFVSPEPTSGCWLWSGAIMGNGYAGIQIGRRNARAHRVSYELNVGPIPSGLMLDHRCHNRACVNPEHLRPATRRQNMSNLSGKAEGKFSSRFTGVWHDRARGNWQANIKTTGRRIHLGRFETEELAAEAYRRARVVIDAKDVS